MAVLDDLCRGGPDERYLFGYLSELKAIHPDWTVAICGGDGLADFIYIREGASGAREHRLTMRPGKLWQTCVNLRRAMREPS